MVAAAGLATTCAFSASNKLVATIAPLNDGHDGTHLANALAAFTGSTFTIGSGVWDISDYVSTKGPLVVPANITLLQGMPDGSTVLGLGASTTTKSMMQMGGNVVNPSTMNPWQLSKAPAAAYGYSQLTGTSYNPVFGPSGRAMPQQGDNTLTLYGNQTGLYGLQLVAGQVVAVSSDDMADTYCSGPQVTKARCHFEMLMVSKVSYSQAANSTTVTFADTFDKTFPRGNIWIEKMPSNLPQNVTLQNITFNGYRAGYNGTANILDVWGIYGFTENNVVTNVYNSGAQQFTWVRHGNLNNCSLNSTASAGGQQTGYGYQFDGCWDFNVTGFSNTNPNLTTESVFIFHSGSSGINVSNSYGCTCDAHGQASNGVTFTNCNAMSATVGNNQWFYGDTNYTFKNCNNSVADTLLYPYVLSIQNKSGNVVSTGSDWGGFFTECRRRDAYIRFPNSSALTGATFSIQYNGVSLPKAGCPSGLAAYTVGSTTYGQISNDLQWEANGETANGIGSQGLWVGDSSGPSSNDIVGGGTGANASVPYDIVFAFTENIALNPPTIGVTDTSGGMLAGIAYCSSLHTGELQGTQTIGFNRMYNNFLNNSGQKITWGSTLSDRNTLQTAQPLCDTGEIGNIVFSGGVIQNLYSASNYCNLVGAGSASRGLPLTGNITFNSCTFRYDNVPNNNPGLNFQSSWKGNLAVTFNGCTTYRTVTGGNPNYHGIYGTQYTGSYGPQTLLSIYGHNCITSWTGVTGTPTWLSLAGSGSYGFSAFDDGLTTYSVPGVLP